MGYCNGNWKGESPIFQNDMEITILEPCAGSLACSETAIPWTIDSSQVALLSIKSFDCRNGWNKITDQFINLLVE